MSTLCARSTPLTPSARCARVVTPAPAADDATMRRTSRPGAVAARRRAGASSSRCNTNPDVPRRDESYLTAHVRATAIASPVNAQITQQSAASRQHVSFANDSLPRGCACLVAAQGGPSSCAGMRIQRRSTAEHSTAVAPAAPQLRGSNQRQRRSTAYAPVWSHSCDITSCVHSASGQALRPPPPLYRGQHSAMADTCSAALTLPVCG